MSLFQRVARLAALSFSVAGVLGSSAIGRANEVERPIAPAAAPFVPQVASPAPGVLDDAIATTAAAPKTRFASLSEAVAAQAVGAGDDDEHLRCLAGAIYFESKGEPLSGQLAVAQVVLNRTKSGRFPSDVCGVIKQRGQFGFVRGGVIPAIDATKLAYRTALAVARVALTEAWEAPVEGALYFNGVRASSPGKRIATIGGHAFYR